jgi:dual-specificity kinase
MSSGRKRRDEEEHGAGRDGAKHRKHHRYKGRARRCKVTWQEESRTERDDSEGHLIMHIGSTLGYDHRCAAPAPDSNGPDRVVKFLGEGTFGKVVECYDRDSTAKRVYAVKVIKSVEKYRCASATFTCARLVYS